MAPHLLTSSHSVRKQLWGRVFAKGTKGLTRSSIFLADRVFLVSSKQGPFPLGQAPCRPGQYVLTLLPYVFVVHYDTMQNYLAATLCQRHHPPTHRSKTRRRRELIEACVRRNRVRISPAPGLNASNYVSCSALLLITTALYAHWLSCNLTGCPEHVLLPSPVAVVLSH